MFIHAVTRVERALFIVPLFVLAMVCLMLPVVLFLNEAQITTGQIQRWF